jgi:hypothetical protein
LHMCLYSTATSLAQRTLPEPAASAASAAETLALVTLLLVALDAVEAGVAAVVGVPEATVLPRLAGVDAGEAAAERFLPGAVAGAPAVEVLGGDAKGEEAAAPLPPLKLRTMRRILRPRLLVVLVWVICMHEHEAPTANRSDLQANRTLHAQGKLPAQRRYRPCASGECVSW